jgi:hypothetical protein
MNSTHSFSLPLKSRLELMEEGKIKAAMAAKTIVASPSIWSTYNSRREGIRMSDLGWDSRFIKAYKK